MTSGTDFPEGATDHASIQSEDKNSGATDEQAGFGIRPGEVTIDLPPTADAGLHFIGHIRTPWKTRAECPRNSRDSDEICTVEIAPAYRPALEGLEGTSHLWLLYFMHRSPRNLLVQVPRSYGRQRGTFALRSPARPNPIAMSAVRLIGIEEGRLLVRGLDCLDGTPLLDVKPYFSRTDCFPEAIVGWHQDWDQERKGSSTEGNSPAE